MLICRTFNSKNSPKELHVHDEPSSYADIQRNGENGWFQTYRCQRDTPYTKGDSKPVFNTVIDSVRRVYGKEELLIDLVNQLGPAIEKAERY